MDESGAGQGVRSQCGFMRQLFLAMVFFLAMIEMGMEESVVAVACVGTNGSILRSWNGYHLTLF